MDDLIQSLHNSQAEFYEQDVSADGIVRDPPISWVRVLYKTYPRFDSIELPSHTPVSQLQHLLTERRTRREFQDIPLPFGSLAKLIQSAAAPVEPLDEDGRGSRPYPSAGARYPVEMYLFARKVSELPSGIYHFSSRHSELERLWEGPLTQILSSVLLNDPAATQASVWIALTAVISRSETKYGPNAYRYALLEAGHLAQNLILLSGELGLSCATYGGFHHHLLSEQLDLVGDELPIYMIGIGPRPENT